MGLSIDREKVIKHIIAEISIAKTCKKDFASVDIDMLSDALALLKEQEAIKPKSKVRHGAYAQIQHFCGNCNAMLHGKPKFCSECGRKVKWE